MGIQELRIGDWVRPHSKGIWRVFRILQGFNEFRYSLDQSKVPSPRILVFSNRLVNNSWKRSFSTEGSALYWVNLVAPEEQRRIDQLLLTDDKLRKAFEKYESVAKPPDLIVNLRFGQFPNSDRERFKVVCGDALAGSIERGLTLDEVLEVVLDAGYKRYMSQNPTLATLQLISLNHELRGPDFVMRRYRFLDF
jgi:hypothetical protein